MKKRLIMIMAAAIIILIGCVKDPAKLGIHPNTLYKGRVIEKSQNKPIKGVTISVTDGSHVHTSQVTGDDGRFEFRVDFDAIDDNYSLQLDCQGYTSLKEDLKGFGQESYDYKDIVYYDNSNPSNWPNVTTDVLDVTSTTARTGGTITYSGAAEITARGVCWGTTHTPNIDGNHTTDGEGTGSFTSNLANLSVNTTYFVRAYATNMHGTYYGEEKTFSTNGGIPVVTTKDITDIHPLSATSGGVVTSDNGFNVTARGICWSVVQNPTIDDYHTANGSGTGEYNSLMENLQNSTTYHVRAYATNANGTAYGEDKSYTTTSGEITVTTNAVTNVTAWAATCGGNATITNDNNLSITAKGVCWSTSHNPSINDYHSNDGSGIGTFTSTISGLSVNTQYYVRAYATNQLGTYYGSEKSFTTTVGLPVVTTTEPTLNGTTVTSGGNVTNDGGFPVTVRGICYGIYPNPDLTSAYTHTTDGSGTGYFTSAIDITVGSTLYVRAYATNTNGTAYGAQVIANLEYLNLPTFTYNGHTYKVAPDPHTSYEEYISWTAANSYCNNLTAYGYSDWRMPTKAELETMYQNRVAIGGFIDYYHIGLYYYDSWYHSSTIATGSTDHYKIVWSDGSASSGYDSGGFYYDHVFLRCHVRPIRVEN